MIRLTQTVISQCQYIETVFSFSLMNEEKYLLMC